MPREIINENHSEIGNAIMCWGWDLKGKDGTRNNEPIALLEIDGISVGLEWGDLDRLNRAVRRAMKHYRKACSQNG